MYGVGGIPHVQFQGTTPVVGGGGDMYPTYLAEYNTIEPTNSPIDLTFDYAPVAGGIDVVANIAMTGDVTTTNNKIVFLATRRISGDYFCTVEVYEFQDFAETTTGETAQYTQTLTMDPTWLITDISIVVMVQTFDGDLMIHQAARGEIIPDSVIDVTVTNMYTNEPVAGAMVSAGAFVENTDANGMCTIDVLGGTYDIVVEKEGYIDATVIDVVADPATPANVAVQLDEVVLPPTSLTQDVAGNWVWLTWAPPAAPDFVLTEDFQNGFPAGWTETTNAAVGWQVSSSGGSQYFVIPDHTSYAYVNDDATGDGSDGSMDIMYMPSVDLTGLYDCTLSFSSFFDGGYGQLASVIISTDGGNNFETLADMSADTAWNRVTIDLSEYLTESDVIIGFHADDAGEWAAGWAIDDIEFGFAGIETLVQGYNIYMDDLTTPSNPEIVTELEYIVTDVPLGEHDFTVKAIFNPGESTPCDLVVADVEVDVPFYPPTIFSYGIEYVVDVTVGWNVPNPVRVQRVDSNGNVTGEAGNDTRTRDHIGYNVYRDGELVDFVTGTNETSLQMLDHDFGTFLYQFTSVYAEGESFAFGDLLVLVQEQDIPALFVDDIEEQTMWQNASYPWTTYDLDGTVTYSILNTDFPGAGAPMPFIVFDPQSTTPPMADFQTAHSGDKCLATFSSDSTENDDWLISQPAVLYNLPNVAFWAKSLSTQYGNDKIEVAVSNGSVDIADFTVISGPNPIETPAGWTRYEFDLGDYEDQMVRVAIHCVSEGTLALLVDDFGIYSAGGVGNDDDTNSIPVNQLMSNYPNPFNPETTISYAVKNSGPVTIDVFNILGKKVTTLVNEDVTAGQHSVVWNGTDSNNKNVASGVYFYRLRSGSFEATNKMILMK